jgi:hypothetical protein
MILHTNASSSLHFSCQQQGTGRSWSFMKAPRMTKARKEEYKVILLRAQLDPKRRYKRMPNKIPKVFQVGSLLHTRAGSAPMGG